MEIIATVVILAVVVGVSISRLRTRKREVAALEANVRDRDSRLSGLLKDVTDRDSQIAGLRKDVKDRDSQIVSLRKGIQDRDSRIAAVTISVNQGQARIGELETQVTSNYAHIRDLQNELNEFQDAIARAGIALVSLDDDGIARFVNSPAEKLGAKISSPLTQIIHPEDIRYFVGSTSSERTWQFDVRLSKEESPVVFVRSVSLNSSLPSLNAGPNERLALLLPISVDDTKRLRWAAVREERLKLGSMLTHGILKQAVLMWKHPKVDPMLQKFAGLLHHRIHVISQVLADWECEVPSPDGPAKRFEIKKGAVYAHLNTLNWLGSYVGAREDLRAEIEWGNGILSQLEPGTWPIRIDEDGWPEADIAETLIANGHMFVLEELIVNAFKYGKHGTEVDVRIFREDSNLTVVVANEIEPLHHRGAPRSYGGTSLVREACRQCGWGMEVATASDAESLSKTYTARIKMPLRS